jgi:hypothetical protein
LHWECVGCSGITDIEIKFIGHDVFTSPVLNQKTKKSFVTTRLGAEKNAFTPRSLFEAV